MGARNPDRISLAERRGRCESVGEMIAQRWDTLSHCRSCGLQMRVDLRVIAIVKGPQFSLWNVKAKCKRLLCNGVVEFHAKAPGMTRHEIMQATDRMLERTPAHLRGRGPLPPAGSGKA